MESVSSWKLWVSLVAGALMKFLTGADGFCLVHLRSLSRICSGGERTKREAGWHPLNVKAKPEKFVLRQLERSLSSPTNCGVLFKTFPGLKQGERSFV